MAIDTDAERQLVLRGYHGIVADAPPAAGGGERAGSLMMMGVGMVYFGLSVVVKILMDITIGFKL